MAEIPRISLPTPSTQQAQDDSAAHARADLQKVRQRHANVGAILQGLGGLANVAQERFNAIANADALIATDKAHTDLVQFSSIMELDLSKSDQPDQAMATYWDEYERTVLALVETLPTAGAQRAFRANANAIKRQRIPYVLDLAEGRSQELVIDQFSGRLYELEQAGNVESISGLFQEFADYLKPGWQGPGGIMDKALARAQTNRFRERGRQIYEEQGPGAASAWLLDNRNMSNLHPSELRGLLMLVDAWTEVDDMTRAEQEQKEMFGLHEAMEQLNAVGIFASPDMIGRLVDEHITSASPDRAAVLKARLIDTTGANDREKSIFSWHLNNRSKNLNAQQVPSFQRFVAAAQVSGRITRTEANRLMDAATGVQTKHKAVGVEHLEGLFEQLQMRNHALENDLDPAEAIVGNALYRDGRQITLGALDGAYIDILNPDGTAGRVYLANELSKLLDEYSDRYEKTLKDTKQVPQDPNQIAVMLWDQWLRQIMPGVQRGDVMGQESGAALYQGGQVTFPGSEEFTFADAWEKAKKRNRRDFDDARAIQMGLDDMHDYVPADIGVTSQPAFREITGQMALQMSGVMDRVDVDLIEWDALMRAGLFQEAGMVAARKLPVDEDALQTLRLNGAITAFRMVPGGARVQLHPLMPWVDVPLMPPTVRLAFTGDDEEVSYAPPTSNGAAAAAQSWQEFLPVPGDAGVGFDAGAGPPPGIDVPADEADAFRWANNQAVRAAMLAPRPGEPGAGIVLMDDQPPTSTAKPVRPGHPGMGAERPGQPGVSPRVASDGLPPTSTAEADRPAHPEMGAELPGQPGVAPRVASDRLPPGATTEAGQPAHPGMGAGSLGEPGVPERIASDRLPPGDETEPGRPAHPGMEAEQQGQPGVPERVASDRLPPEDETEPSRPLRDRIATTVVDVEAEELPDLTLPEGKWPADSELPIYEGVYDVHDLVDTSIETLRLWNAGGRGMAVEEAAGYLENISRNARDMLSSEAQSRLDATLGEYYGRKRMQPEDHRMTGSGSDLAPSQRDIPTSIDLPELGGPGAGAPIGSGYSGLNRDDDAGSKSRPRQEGLGPPPMMPGAAGGMSVLPDTPWGPASQPSRPTTQGRGIQRPGEPGAGIVLMDDQPPGPTAEPGRPAHPVMSAGRLGQPGVPPPAAGAAPASTAAAGRPAHPGMGAGRPGELTEAGQPVTTMGVTDMPTPPPNPALAWEVPPEFHLIGVDTGGVQLYVSVQPGEPPPPPMTAGRPGELAVAGTFGQPPPDAAQPTRPAHPEMGAERPGQPGVSPRVASDGLPPTSMTEAGRPAHPGMGATRPGELTEAGQPVTTRAQVVPGRPGHPSGVKQPVGPPSLPAGYDIHGQPYQEPGTPMQPQMVVTKPGGLTMIAVPIGVNADGTPVFKLLREMSAPAHPGMGAGSLGEPGVPERVASDRLPPGDETEPGRPAHPVMGTELPGEPGAAGTFEHLGAGAAPPARPGHPGMGAERQGQPGEPPPAAGDAPASTAAAGRPAHPEQTGARPGQLGEPPPAAGAVPSTSPAAAAPAHPEQTAGRPGEPAAAGAPAQPGTAGQPAEPPPPPMTAGRPGELAVAGTFGQPPPDAAQPTRPAHPEMGAGRPGELGVPGVPPGVTGEAPAEAGRPVPPIQEAMAEVVMAGDLAVKLSAHRVATDAIFGGNRIGDALMVAESIMTQAQWREVPESVRQAASLVMAGDESGASRMASWYLDDRYPDWNWKLQQPKWRTVAGGQQAATNAPIRELPEPEEWADKAQVQQLIRLMEGRPRGGDIENGQLKSYKDIGKGWIIGYGSAYMYGRQADGSIEATRVTANTRLPRDLPEGQDLPAAEVAESQFVLGIEYHYGQMLNKFRSRNAENALNWLDDAQLATLTSMSYQRGPTGMVDSPSGRELVAALQARDLDAINRAWWPTFSYPRAIEATNPYVRGAHNRRAGEAAMFFGGFPEEINADWKESVPATDLAEKLRRRALHKGITPSGGHLVQAGHEELADLLPSLSDMDIVTQMAAWGLDTLTPSASYLWMTGPDGTLPPHLQSYLKRTVTMPDGNTLFILG